MIELFKKAIKQKRNANGLVEYGLILALVSIVAVGSLSALGKEMKVIINQINTGIKGTDDNPCPPGAIYIPSTGPGSISSCGMY